MTENRHSAQPDSARLTTRTKLTDSFNRQKSATGGVTNKRKGALVQQPSHLLNQGATAQTPGAEKDPKKMAKVEIPVSLDIDPFSATDSFTSPSATMDELLSAKEGRIDTRARPDDITSPESRKSAATPSPHMSEAEAAALRARMKKVEMESVTLRHTLLELKAELKAAEDRLREKDIIIKDQEERINDLIDTRVPMDDMNDVMTENERLQKELKDSEAMLAECQKVLEAYAAADEDL